MARRDEWLAEMAGRLRPRGRWWPAVRLLGLAWLIVMTVWGFARSL